MGILQGSALGCLLFSLYINDIVKIGAVNTDITLYADDTNVLNTDIDLPGVFNKANNSMSKMSKCMEKYRWLYMQRKLCV